MLKNTISVILAAILAFSLTGCINQGQEYGQWEIIKPTTQKTGLASRPRNGGGNEEIIIPKLLDDATLISTMNNYIDSLITQTDGFIPSWNKEVFKGCWNYIDGVFLNSIVRLYRDTNNTKYREFFINYINYYINANGEFVDPRTNQNSFITTELDSICESKILFDAYEFTHDERYLKGIDYTYNILMSQHKVEGSDYNYEHKAVYPNQIWLDGMYMYVPFYARYAQFKGDSSIYTNITEAYKYIRQNMFDENKKLYFHGYDSTREIFWSDKSTGCSPSFWLRSMGWYITSLTDCIEYFPEGEDKEYLKGLLKEALDGINNYKDPVTNMFYQIVDKDRDYIVHVDSSYLEPLVNKTAFDSKTNSYVDKDIKNYLEVSGSSLIAYSMMKSSRLNYVDKDYYQTGEEIFQGISANYLSIDNTQINLKNICITSGLGPDNMPYRDGTHAYYLAEPIGENDAKGIGPFILAFLEYEKVAH